MIKSHLNTNSSTHRGLLFRSMLRAALLPGFLLSVCFSFAQDSTAVKASVDKNQIVVGDPIRLSIDIRRPAGVMIQLPQIDSIPHFALLGKGRKDSLSTASGSSYHLEWKLTSFDSGLNRIPSFPVVIGNQSYQTDSLLVQVSYGSMDSLKEYHDIRGIIDKENPAVKYILWVLLALTLLGILFFAWAVSRPAPLLFSEPAEQLPIKSRLAPLEEALHALDALKQMPLPDAAAVKKYYSAMNDVLRVFLVRSMNLSAMVRTNEELILQLSRIDMHKESFSHLAGVLRMSDFVKFAKYVPDQYDNERNLDLIRSSIMIINEIRK